VIAQSIVHFARLLRSAGMAIGPDRVLVALAAVEQVGVLRRDDVRAALCAAMLERHEQQSLFDEAFDAFWGDPQQLAQSLSPLARPCVGKARRPAYGQRLAEALRAAGKAPVDDGAVAGRPLDGRFTASEAERLRRADFESMSTTEYEWAKTLAEQVPLPIAPVRRRRHQIAIQGRQGGRIDLRATLMRMARQPHTLQPVFSRPREEPPSLVVLLDISASMERYSRLMLHYVHGLMRRALKVHTLTFGTRLTNITRCLRERDPDVALRLADAQVPDWNGGTRIASALHAFNRLWAPRLLGGNAAVLLITDGLDRDPNGDLPAEAARLRRFAHQLVWLNPLLRFDGFEARASGVRALLPHVDRFLPVHNLDSLADLGTALRKPLRSPRSYLN